MTAAERIRHQCIRLAGGLELGDGEAMAGRVLELVGGLDDDDFEAAVTALETIAGIVERRALFSGDG